MIELLKQQNESIADNIWSVFQNAYRAEALLLGVDTLPPLERSKESIRISDTVFWCFKIEGKPAGVIETKEKSNSVSIFSLAVLTDYSRKGIASALIKHVIQAGRGKSLLVHTARLNFPAFFLYRKFGFIEKASWTGRDGVRLVVLERSADQ